MQNHNTPEIAWKESEAKRLLYDDIVSGEVSEDLAPALVYGMRTEFSPSNMKTFERICGLFEKASEKMWLVLMMMS
jgi:hypothetical protein